jgi:SAM-dependent methyltransferase
MLEEHLGGHNGITHVDQGSLDWLIASFHPDSFLDIGCGPGGMVELADQKGLTSLGIDGDYTIQRSLSNNFLIHDFTTGPAPLDNIYDIGWSCEFVEHVEEQYQPAYMKAFQQCKIIAMTYAPPGHTGYHHVNLQHEDYWIKIFKQYGFNYSSSFTNHLRHNSTMGDKKKHRFVKNRGLVFINKLL